MKQPQIIDVKNTTLDEWLELVRKPPANKVFIRNMFPTDKHKNEWIQTALSRSDEDVKLLLRKHTLV